jgi:hypothetical protein
LPLIVFSSRELDTEERIRIQDNIHLIVEKASLDPQQFMDIIKNELK